MDAMNRLDPVEKTKAKKVSEVLNPSNPQCLVSKNGFAENFKSGSGLSKF